MSRELAFLVYCMERYRHFKGLSGADVARLFDEHGVYRYIIKYFESLHTCLLYTSMDKAYDDLKKKLDGLANEFPEDVQTPTIIEMDINDTQMCIRDRERPLPMWPERKRPRRP